MAKEAKKPPLQLELLFDRIFFFNFVYTLWNFVYNWSVQYVVFKLSMKGNKIRLGKMIGIICCAVVLALRLERYIPKFFYVMKKIK
jgi:hypothetical protein